MTRKYSMRRASPRGWVSFAAPPTRPVPVVGMEVVASMPRPAQHVSCASCVDAPHGMHTHMHTHTHVHTCTHTHVCAHTHTCTYIHTHMHTHTHNTHTHNTHTHIHTCTHTYTHTHTHTHMYMQVSCWSCCLRSAAAGRGVRRHLTTSPPLPLPLHLPLTPTLTPTLALT